MKGSFSEDLIRHGSAVHSDLYLKKVGKHFDVSRVAPAVLGFGHFFEADNFIFRLEP